MLKNIYKNIYIYGFTNIIFIKIFIFMFYKYYIYKNIYIYGFTNIIFIKIFIFTV